MENSKSKIIKEIAPELDYGSNCYFNLKTEEIIAIPNFNEFWEEAEFRDAFSIEIDKVNKNKAEYIKMEVLESFESFKIMERFVSQITDKLLQSDLETILYRKKPFQNFKNRIDHSNYRQAWFDFKQKELENIVETQLNRGVDSTQ